MNVLLPPAEAIHDQPRLKAALDRIGSLLPDHLPVKADAHVRAM